MKKGRIETRISANFEQCRLGYAGWLVTDSTFCRTRDDLREQWSDGVESLGYFPGLPLSLLGESRSAPLKGFEKMNLAFQEFYQLWGLESFVTWDLPVPMKTDLVNPTLYDVSSMSLAGNTFFVPWFMMRAKNVGLKDLMSRRLTTAPPEHLLGWIEASDTPNRFGVKRFAAMLSLYLYIELALKQRYPDRLFRATELLDEIFIASIGIGKSSDSVRKVRQAMQKRLAAIVRNN